MVTERSGARHGASGAGERVLSTEAHPRARHSATARQVLYVALMLVFYGVALTFFLQLLDRALD